MPASQQKNSAVQPYWEETLVASATRTTSGDSGVLTGFGPCKHLRLVAVATAIAGTPNVVISVEDTLDGTNWNSVGAFTALTAAGTQALNITTPFADRIRIKWVVTGGTPSMTFKVDACSEVDPS